MKNTSKLLRALMLSLALFVCVCMLFACGGDETPDGDQTSSSGSTSSSDATPCEHKGGTATCTAKAVCSECGEEYGELAAHDYADATCTAPKTCKACEATDGAALGHDEIDDVVAPTCVAEGITNVTCSRCDYTSTKDAVPATGAHVYDVKGVTVDPTCTDAGYTVYSCSAGACGTTENKDPVDALGHDEQYDTVDPTCTEAGITNITCTRCDYTSTKDPVDALGHDEQYEVINPDCLNAGITNITCTRCDYTSTKDPVDALGHDEQYEVIDPDCLNAGITNITCTRCDYTSTKDPTDALGHTGGTATCTTLAVCERVGCGASYGELADHTYNTEDTGVEGVDYEITTAPTCISEGVKTYKCTVCAALATNEDYIVVVDKAEHKYDVAGDITAPTCITKGYTTYGCSAGECGTTEDRDETDMIGHNYSVVVEVVAPTCITKGYTTYSCSSGECGTTKNLDETAVVGHAYTVAGDVVAPTCSAEGYTVYGCSAGACGLTEHKDFTRRVAHTFVDVNDFDEILCTTCQQSYRNINTQVSTGDGTLCLGCEGDEEGNCVCNVKVEWNGYIAPEEVFVDADAATAIEELEGFNGGLVRLTSEEETTLTITVNGEEFTVTGTDLIVDLYSFETVESLSVYAAAGAELIIYKAL